ncbi:MAG: glycosyltransferase family 2 protein [Candidatus Choladocola sp.]|nr:glycosyltransferase family 2 protein [Candidatus Choladocola sp.]
MAENKWNNFLKKLNLYNIRKGIRYLRHFGVKEFLIRLSDRMEPEEVPYGPWYEQHRADRETLKAQEAVRWSDPVTISIAVPLYRTPAVYLRQMIESVQNQTYPYWELCLANGSPEDEELCRLLSEYSDADGRIRVKNLTQNDGIAGNTNEALAMASGQYIGLLDHDDLLAPDALYAVASLIREAAGRKETLPDLIYTDEDKVSADLAEHFQPNLKPDFNPDLLRSNNYICHFLVVSKKLREAAGGFDSRYDGAQDYDFILRCTEKAERICHIPRILYHWRTHAGSTADNPISKQYAYDAGKRAIEAHLLRCGLSGEVMRKKDFGFYRVKYRVEGNPLISIIIPNKDEKETLQKCLRSIFERSSYRNFEIIIVENNSKTEEIFDYYKEIDGRNGVHVVYWDRDFNYSAINNFGIRHAKGQYLVCLNNDMEVISEDWLEELLGHCQRPDTGIVGARLYYPDDTIQHAGIIVGLGGVAGNIFVGMKRSHTGYMHRESLQQDLSAVTAACMMVKREAYDAAGGFEEKLAVAFNDVDFCLRVGRAGYLTVYDPYVELYHYESKTRGAEDTKEKVRRFQEEIEYMRSHWITLLKNGDPCYNRNLSLTKWNYSLKYHENSGR